MRPPSAKTSSLSEARPPPPQLAPPPPPPPALLLLLLLLLLLDQPRCYEKHTCRMLHEAARALSADQWQWARAARRIAMLEEGAQMHV